MKHWYADFDLRKSIEEGGFQGLVGTWYENIVPAAMVCQQGGAGNCFAILWFHVHMKPLFIVSTKKMPNGQEKAEEVLENL